MGKDLGLNQGSVNVLFVVVVSYLVGFLGGRGRTW